MVIEKYRDKIKMLKDELSDAGTIEDILIGFPKSSKKGIIDIYWINL